jgi:hypothetical protein
MVLFACLEHKPKLSDSTIQASLPHLLLIVRKAWKLCFFVTAQNSPEAENSPFPQEKELVREATLYRTCTGISTTRT